MRKYIEKNPADFMMWSILGLTIFMLPGMFSVTNDLEEKATKIAQDCVDNGGQWVPNVSVVSILLPVGMGKCLSPQPQSE